MFTKTLIFIFLFTFGALAGASDYSNTLSMCRAFSNKNIESELPKGQVTYDKTLEQSKIYNGVTIGFKNLYQGAKTALTLEGFGTSPETKQLLGSEGFYRALKECFGDFDENRYAWDSFTLLIILSDAAGQSFAYVGSTVVSIGAMNKAIQFVKYGFKIVSATPYLAAHPEIVSQISLAGKAISIGYVLKVGHDAINDTLHPEIKTKKNIHEKEIPKLQSANDDLLNVLAVEIQNETIKPPKLRDQTKINKLTKIYNARKQNHENNVQKLRDLANS